MSGEYAVLAGAPALVMATNRYAHCTLTSIAPTTQTPHWQFDATGFESESTHPLKDLLAAENISAHDPARLCAWVLKQLLGSSTNDSSTNERTKENLPETVRVQTDTREMYHRGTKLGLGSSAALTTALAGALWRLANHRPPEFADIHAAHQASQNGVGSGLDIATSLTGGVIRFQNAAIAPLNWPDGIKYRFVYAGKPASTPELVGRFNTWREATEGKETNSRIGPKRRKTAELAALINASATLANGAINLDNFARYIEALRALDEAATIGIYSSGHKEIATAAERSHVLYKPCGAGGGDLGVALSHSEQDLDCFTADIGNTYAVIDLEIASNGLSIG